MRDAKKTLLERLEKLGDFNKFYDEGRESYAVDIATTIRTICKDNNNTQSLLSRVGIKSQIIFCIYSDLIVHPQNLATSNPLCSMEISVGKGIKSARFIPKLDDVEKIGSDKYDVKFNQCWDQVVIKDKFGSEFTRKDLIETVCDKEGGAHFDQKLGQKSSNLFYDNSIGWVAVSSNNPSKPFDNKVHFASIRHISYELLNALNKILR